MGARNKLKKTSLRPSYDAFYTANILTKKEKNRNKKGGKGIVMKNKNLEDLNYVGHEQLFAELNPAEASLIEGGATVCLDLISIPDYQQARLVVDGREVWCGNPDNPPLPPLLPSPSFDRCINFRSSATIELVDSCF